MQKKESELLLEKLHSQLSILNKYKGCTCAFLDGPSYPNIGDHMIWIGSLLYLHSVLQAEILYTADYHDFSQKTLNTQCSEGPIFLNGGGNLGDLWQSHQNHKEYIIKNNMHRPIIVLPQTVYFRNQESIQKAAKTFNSHPNLTLFVRDSHSFEFANKHFEKCQIVKSPDMAFQLKRHIPIRPFPSNGKTLYHFRKDIEKAKSSTDKINKENAVSEDWISYSWVYGNKGSFNARFIATPLREIWQRRLKNPKEWINRIHWNHNIPDILKDDKHNSKRILHSWDLIHSGFYQFSKNSHVVTDRLHGHIMCILLDIHHIFLPNSYHKNRGFFEAWNKDSKICKFSDGTNSKKTEFVDQ